MRRQLLALFFVYSLALTVCAQTVVRRPILSGGGSEPLLTNLTASWKLSDLTDAIGSNTLTNNNSVTFNTGKIGNAGYFTNGSSRYLSIASNSAVQTGDVDWTIGAWVYTGDLSTLQIAWAKRGDTAGQDEYVLYYDGINRLSAIVFSATDSAHSVTANNFGAPSIFTFYCVIVWHDAAADTINISVNDGATNSAATGGALQAASNGEFDIGRQNKAAGFGYWEGRIDNVNIWKRVLTAGERTRFYNGGTGCEHAFGGC
jgi:hypothetical protein